LAVMSTSRKRRRAEEEEQEEEEGEDEAVQRDEEAEDDELQRRLNERRNADNERLGDLYENFIRVATPEQLERFEHWKRSKLPRAAMRRLMADMLGSSTERGAIVLAAVAKMFVGEMVESAREQMTATGESGPIQPTHLRQAHRRAQRAGIVPPSSRHSARLFWRGDCGS